VAPNAKDKHHKLKLKSVKKQKEQVLNEYISQIEESNRASGLSPEGEEDLSPIGKDAETIKVPTLVQDALKRLQMNARWNERKQVILQGIG